MSSFDIDNFTPGTRVLSPFESLRGILSPGQSSYAPYAPLPAPTIDIARALAASQGANSAPVIPQIDQVPMGPSDASMGVSGPEIPQLSMSERLGLQFRSQPDYSQKIGAAIGGFENASNAYQKNALRLAGEDAKLIEEASKIKAKRDLELAGVEEQRQQSAKGASEALGSAQEINQEIQDSTAKEIGSLYDELKKNSDIDPDRYMKNMSTGSSIASAIGLILGGIGSGLTGGPNHAVQILENRINSDIRAQIEKRNGLKDLIAEKREQLGDARAAMLGTANLIQLDSAQQMLGLAAQAAQIEKRAEGTLEGNTAGILKNELYRRAQDKFLGIQESVTNLKLRGYAAQADVASAQQSAMAQQMGGQILPSQLMATAPLRPEMAKAVTEKLGDYNEVIGHLQTLEKLREKSGKSGVWTGQDKYAALQTSKALFNAKRKMTGSGAALSPMEEELIKMKDPNKMTIGIFDDVLGEIRAERGVVERAFRDQLRANNVVLKEDAQKQQLTQGWQAQ